MSSSERVAIYLRQSVDLTEGIDRQRARCGALVAARGWEVVATYEDNDVSANKRRGADTGWGRMLAAIERGEVDVVVAVNLDRLLRSQGDLLTLIGSGAKVVTAEGELDLTSASGEMQASVLTAMARFESRRRNERMIAGYQHRVAQGQMIGGWRSFGFAGGGSNRLVPREVAAIRAGYRDLLVGVPLGKIARQWNANMLRTTHGTEWTRSSVRKVLLNPRNAALVTYRGEVRRDVQAAWLPIVDESTFLAAKAMLENPARRTGKPTGKRLLTGVARCGVCGATVHAGGAVKAGNFNYRCGGSGGHVARLAEPVEEYVVGAIVARLSRDDARDLVLAQQGPDAQALAVEAAGIRQRLDALAVDYADGVLTREQVAAATGRLRDRLAEVEARQADAGRVDVLGDLVGDGVDVRAVWDSLGVERQRAVIDLLAEVTLLSPGRGARSFRPETVLIDWKVDPGEDDERVPA
jgi:site-specific DNA recombinase